MEEEEEEEVQNNENTDIIVLVSSQGLAPATKFAPLILLIAHLKVTVGNTLIVSKISDREQIPAVWSETYD